VSLPARLSLGRARLRPAATVAMWRCNGYHRCAVTSLRLPRRWRGPGPGSGRDRGGGSGRWGAWETGWPGRVLISQRGCGGRGRWGTAAGAWPLGRRRWGAAAGAWPLGRGCGGAGAGALGGAGRW